MTDKIEVTQADRDAAADLLDTISSLLDHTGIGQVADLIRDGEYDEHDATKSFATHRLAGELAGRMAERKESRAPIRAQAGEPT